MKLSVKVTFIYLILFIEYHYYYNQIHSYNIFTIPNTNDRTAILITGQLRSGNTSWFSGEIKKDFQSKMFGGDDPPSPIATVMAYLIEPFARYGGVDVFIYNQLKGNNCSNIGSDGTNRNDVSYIISDQNNQDIKNLNYEITTKDHKLCEIYSGYDVFHPKTGNKVFCLTECEEILSNSFLSKYPMWNTYYDKSNGAIERLLQQLYGQYRGNLAVKQYSLANNMKYKYKMRIRPDIAMIKPMRTVQTLVDSFQKNGKDCKRTIYYPNWRYYPLGGEDSFNIGESEDMDKVLDRYIDIISKPFIFKRYRTTDFWNSESYLIGILSDRYKICFESEMEIWFVVIRLSSHRHDVIKYNQTIDNDWVLMT